jgi:hypothetical protein
VVGYKAQGKLLGGLGKFCATIKHKSINFIKNNPLLNPQEYLTTPEGLLFKAAAKSNKSMPVEKADSSSGLKKTIDDKVSKQNALPKIPTASKGVICQGNLRAKIEEHSRHIFSEDHKKRGIMAAGENQEIIMDSLWRDHFIIR